MSWLGHLYTIIIQVANHFRRLTCETATYPWSVRWLRSALCVKRFFIPRAWSNFFILYFCSSLNFGNEISTFLFEGKKKVQCKLGVYSRSLDCWSACYSGIKLYTEKERAKNIVCWNLDWQNIISDLLTAKDARNNFCLYKILTMSLYQGDTLIYWPVKRIATSVITFHRNNLGLHFHIQIYPLLWVSTGRKGLINILHI